MPRFQFLNWRPDLEDAEFDGLTVADNVVHEPEGWRPVYLGSAAQFATTGSLASVTSIVSKAVGSQNDTFSAWYANGTVYVGVNGITSPTTATGYPLAFASAIPGAEITAFDVAEYAGKIVWTVECRGNQVSPATIVSLSGSGVLDYT